MMKRIICLVLCVMLACVSTAAFAAHYDTLPEKLARQLEKGSGLKGAMTLEVEGEADWAKQLAPLSGVQLTLRGISAGQDFQYTVYEGPEDGEHKGLTQAYTRDGVAYLRSDLLIDTILSLPLHGDLLSSVTGIGSANPTIYSAVAALAGVKAAEWDGDWATALAPYYEQIDRWMQPYAGEPKVERVGVVSQLEISYTLPAEAVKQEMKTLLHQALSDEALSKLLKAAMTEEQAAAYLDPSLAWYYDVLIDMLPLGSDVSLVHVVSAQGDMLSTVMTFPLANAGDWQTLTVTQEGQGEGLTVALTSAKEALTLVWDQDGEDGFTGSLRREVLAGENSGFAFAIEKKTDAYADEDGRRHEVTDWMVELAPADGSTALAPASAQLRLHYYSKTADNQATTLEAALVAQLPDAKVSFAGRFRSASSWELDQTLPTEGAKDLSAMTAEERAGIFEDLFANALIVLGEEKPAEETAATVTDLPLQEEKQ